MFNQLDSTTMIENPGLVELPADGLSCGYITQAWHYCKSHNLTFADFQVKYILLAENW